MDYAEGPLICLPKSPLTTPNRRLPYRAPRPGGRGDGPHDDRDVRRLGMNRAISCHWPSPAAGCMALISQDTPPSRPRGRASRDPRDRPSPRDQGPATPSICLRRSRLRREDPSRARQPRFLVTDRASTVLPLASSDGSNARLYTCRCSRPCPSSSYTSPGRSS